MLKRIGAGLAGLCTALLLFAAPAHATTGAQKLTIVFSGDPRSGMLGRVIATGVITGVGKDETIAQDARPDGSETDIDLITLPGGTITVVDTDPGDLFQFDSLSCTARIGTNAGTFTARGLVIFDRVAGGCSEEPRSFFAVVTATGTISVP